MKLNTIQQTLKAPKGQTNNFGKYRYRSCEDILEAVKPILGDCAVTLNDAIEVHGDRVYVKATAYLLDENHQVIASADGFAREPQSKKGMDESQITGAASSYARKYALNALFAIDDTKDADSTNNHGNVAQPKPQAKADPLTGTQKSAVLGLVEQVGLDVDKVVKAIKWASGNRTDSLNALSYVEGAKLIKFLEGKVA